MAYLLFFPLITLMFCVNFFTKKYQTMMPEWALGYILYTLITGIFTTGSLYITNGCSIAFTKGLALLAAGYGVL